MAARSNRKWADVDEDDEETFFAPGGKNFETRPDEHGIKTVVDYVERGSKTYKVVKRVKQTVVTSWTNDKIKSRLDMKKFGKALTNDPTQEKNLVVRCEEEIPIEISRKLAVQASVKDEAEEKFYEESLAMAENMNQQKKAWTEINRLKQVERDEVGAERPNDPDKPSDIREAAEAAKAGDAPKSTYVPPSLRGKGEDGKGKGKGDFQQQQEASLRITNLSEDVREGDLQDLFGQVGRLQRVYLAKDPTTGQSRGFAFVTYYTREDAQKAIDRMNGHGYDNLILQVQFAKPRQWRCDGRPNTEADDAVKRLPAAPRAGGLDPCPGRPPPCRARDAA
eukprot:CAMPEP_0170225520 /NCGR_PEP_ID=MMETSP0116_2-20130129/12469_1 /TAXON_ID=400756 /ORGANISM="Durinskia baltica, Strain CSIRO CS-38" /LENGTH=335 /DNA_ID=CAMNT_0010476241 /DNA_START=45 /DNA_END=1049 /DNA_ORIENTATION=-